MAKYLSLQHNTLNGKTTDDDKELKNKIIVSVSNLYHIDRLVYLMKNFIPKATHYGVIGGEETDEEMVMVKKSATSGGATNSIKQAYDQSFTRDLGYIVPTFSTSCVQGSNILDLGLFEFLIHHGLYHSTKVEEQIQHPMEPRHYHRDVKVWNTEKTSKQVIQNIGDFCLPFTSLGNWKLKDIVDTEIFKENGVMAMKKMGTKRYMQLYTFASVGYSIISQLLWVDHNILENKGWNTVDRRGKHGGHKGGGVIKQKRKKRTRGKKKKKKNRSRKK